MLGNAPHFSEQVWNQALQFASHNLTPYLYNILAALLILLIGKWLAGRIVAIATPAIEERTGPTIGRFLARLILAALLTFVAIAALTQVGVQTTSLIAIFGAAGLAVALSLKDSLAHFAAGVMLVSLRPFKIGDYVEVAGTNGTVQEISIFSTTLATDDNCVAIIPNGSIVQAKIINYSSSATRKMNLTVRVPYGANLATVKDELLGLARQDPRFLAQPAPQVSVTNLGDTGVDLRVSASAATAEYWNARFALIERIKNRLGELGLALPARQLDVRMDPAAPCTKAVNSEE
ncbi:MAG: mechanosensitive ion channel family protein [Nevskiaceae bacterium]|nr:MAG: mechanosensitive ion channel family protein [Nevskiaceae bacterium]TBR72531.1 MAG: mechanosensitive ion channel family protein [Nevskiaceae bacterium]